MELNDRKTATIAGHLCLDIIPDMKSVSGDRFFNLFQPGRLVEVNDAALSTGGAASNTGLSMNILGVESKIIAKVGNDLFGGLVKNILCQYNPSIADSLILDDTSGTSYTVIINPPGIDRIFLHSPGANNHFTGTELNYESFKHSSIFHFGYPQLMKQMYCDGGENLKDIFFKVQNVGIPTSLDVTFPDPSTEMGKVDWRAILQKALPYVDVFNPSIEEILFMIFPEIYSELIQKGGILDNLTAGILSLVSEALLEFGVNILLIKLGDKGLYLRTKCAFNDDVRIGKLIKNPHEWLSKEVWSPCFSVNVAGTTGAGDATIAGFLTAMLHGFGPVEAVNFAAAVGACNVERSDALSGVKSWDETIDRIKSGWSKSIWILPGVSDWTYDPVHDVRFHDG